MSKRERRILSVVNRKLADKAMELDIRLSNVWAATHEDYRAVIDGRCHILVGRAGVTTLVPLGELTDAEIASRLPRKS